MGKETTGGIGGSVFIQRNKYILSEDKSVQERIYAKCTLRKDKDGNIISDPQDILVQWNGYFDDLRVLNKNINIDGANEENQDIQQLSLNDDEHLEVLTYQE
jgi:hypothetical protein